MTTLITSDLHLTDKSRDEYRWDLFPWIKEQVPKKQISTILFLGDTTDAKDKHSSKLTNRIVDIFTDLSSIVEKFYILRGNHDYIDENIPFFKFLNHIKNVVFIVEPTMVKINNQLALLVPNMHNFSQLKLPKNIKYLFCHQTFKGAKSESGMEMEGIPPAMFDNWDGHVISGDIHAPQKLYHDKIEYCGSPYHVHFGDNFLPRVLLLEDSGKLSSLYFKTTRRYTIQITDPTELNKISILKGDQIKIRLELDDLVNWESSKKQVIEFCKSKEIDLHQLEFVKQDISLVLENQKIKLKSLTPKELFDKYCEVSAVGLETKFFGEKLMEE